VVGVFIIIISIIINLIILSYISNIHYLNILG